MNDENDHPNHNLMMTTTTTTTTNTKHDHSFSSSSSSSSLLFECIEIKNSPYKLIGTFGDIYLTRHKQNGKMFATKLAPKKSMTTTTTTATTTTISSNASITNLRQEYELYLKLGPAPGLPKVYFFGECVPPSHESLVMELLGPSLEQVFVACERKFTVSMTTQLAVQILTIIRYIHSRKIIFCNVKPENFRFGLPNTSNADQVHLIGFVHARTYETDQHQHVPKTRIEFGGVGGDGGGGVFGTPRYMSLNAHKGKMLSRRDDLESIGYMLIYFLQGKLPWQGLQQYRDECEKYERIYALKKSIKLEELCANLPTEYYHYMLYVRTLKFAQEPNYQYLLQMFDRLLSRLNMNISLTAACQRQVDNNNIEQQQQQKQINDLSLTMQQLLSFELDTSTPTTPTTLSAVGDIIHQQCTTTTIDKPIISNQMLVPVNPNNHNNLRMYQQLQPYQPQQKEHRKQVSFNDIHETINIQSDLYFPFMRKFVCNTTECITTSTTTTATTTQLASSSSLTKCNAKK